MVGQLVVNPNGGAAWPIIDVGLDFIQISSPETFSASSIAIAPRFAYYKANIEHGWFNETYTIGVHVANDPSTLLYLHGAIVYILCRYRESLLEANGFYNSSFSSSDLAPNSAFGAPNAGNAFSRYITLSGQVENSWIKTPDRLVESVLAKDPNGPVDFDAGIKIISNLNTPPDLADQPWLTVD